MLSNRARAEHALHRMGIPASHKRYVDYREAITAELNERAGDDARAAESVLRERMSDPCMLCRSEVGKAMRENSNLLPRKWPVGSKQ